MSQTLYACLTCVSSDYTKTGELMCKSCKNNHEINMNHNHITKEYNIYDDYSCCKYCENNNSITLINNVVSNDYNDNDCNDRNQMFFY